MTQKLTPLRLERLETELHVQTVLAMPMPRWSTPSAAASCWYPHPLDLCLAAARRGARADAGGAPRDLRPDPCRQEAGRDAGARNHVKEALEPNIERVRQIARLPASAIPPFLLPVDLPNASKS